jgi:hypothetical protein
MNGNHVTNYLGWGFLMDCRSRSTLQPTQFTALDLRSYSIMLFFLFFKFLGVRWDWVRLVRRQLIGPDDGLWWMWSSPWNENWQGKPKYSEKTCPSATSSTTNPPWTDLGSNSGSRREKPATNHLSYGTACSIVTPQYSCSGGVWIQLFWELHTFLYLKCELYVYTILRLEDNIKMDLRKLGWGGRSGFIWLRLGTSGRPL